MGNKTIYYSRASVALLLFVILGYTVAFYPEQLVAFDSSLQTAIRGQLPEPLTSFFTHLTVLGNTFTQVLWVTLFAILFYVWKNWRAEAALVLVSGLSAAVLISLLKLVYERPRPNLLHLVEAHGYSFPSGHATGAMLIFGSLLIVLTQRMNKGWLKGVSQVSGVLLIVGIGLSRIYLGVHYPSGVLAGFTLGYAVLNLIYPTYMSYRFKWRFKGLSQ